MALNPRAREAGADTPSSVSRPTALEPAGRRFANFFFEQFFFENSDSGAHDGARAFGADADDDGVVAAAPASYGVIANRRH